MDTYFVYCLLGLAELEELKVFLWPQWRECFTILDPVFKPFAKTSFIKSQQAFEIPLKASKSDPPGTRRVTYKNVSMGKLRWSLDDNKKWSQRMLEESEYPIRMIETRILSTNSKTQPPELQVSIFNRDTSPGCAYNQVVSLVIAESEYLARGAEFWDGLVQSLAIIASAVRIGKTTRPWWLERRRESYTEGSSLADADFSTRYDCLDLNDSWQTWEYLK